MEVPLLRFHIKGKCLESELQYTPHSGDEVEDLNYALKTGTVDSLHLFYT